MATIKSYTDLPQSKKLAEILPLESADMYHFIDDIDKVYEVGFGYRKITADYYSKTKLEYIPAWSLAALLNVLKDYTLQKIGKDVFVIYENEKVIGTEDYDNPVDACVAVIEKLHELKML